MATLKDIRQRRKSVESTKKITSAMKMVAASKFRTLVSNWEESRGIFSLTREMIGRTQAFFDSDQDLPPLLRPFVGTPKRHVWLLFSSNQGLCGNFNAALTKLVRTRYAHMASDSESPPPFVLCVGRKGYDALRKYISDIELVACDAATSKEEVIDIVLKRVFSLLNEENYEICHVIYAHFKNALSQDPIMRQLIPLSIPRHPDGLLEKGALYGLEPAPYDLLEHFSDLALQQHLSHLMIETQLSEQAARMTAMEQATRNADDMIRKLELTYNSMRQAGITKELMEIIAGAESS